MNAGEEVVNVNRESKERTSAYDSLQARFKVICSVNTYLFEN
jgi:hypothetical protein